MPDAAPDTWRTRPDAARRCDGCEACCTIMAVRELDKAPWTPCHLLAGQGQGCGVWGDHPWSCRTFACLWRGSDTLLPPDMFPADCGFLLALAPGLAWPAVVNICPLADRTDAWDTPRNREIFSGLAAAWNALVVVLAEGLRASHVFAPNGAVYGRADHPEMFPKDGAELALPSTAYGPDQGAPARRIAAAHFSWRRARRSGPDQTGGA